MEDGDWSPVTSRREKRRNRDDELREERLRAEAPHRSNRTRDLAWFDENYQRPAETDAEYDREHALRYGKEEGMNDGKHQQGNMGFPTGSRRDKSHARYVGSTGQRDRARTTYTNAKKAHKLDNSQWTEDEKRYYKHTSDDLLPTQHADLSSRALDLADAAWK